jgi:hypothetical protein
MMISDFRFRISDFQFRIVLLKVAIIAKSAISNPQSEIIQVMEALNPPLSLLRSFLLLPNQIDLRYCVSTLKTLLCFYQI